MPLSVLIVGAGMAGLAAAIGFVRHGHHVTVVERKSELAEETGSGILLGPNAMRVIEAWGLKDTFEEVAHINGETNLRRFQTGQVVKNIQKPKGSLMLVLRST
jgi:salicylate hydroxylase